ncbi:branched-chain amino acid ABC transporter permease [Halorubrum yunnanense]|uniref:Branched-chain amino acid ABC transporter permease n=2 Tax=Halorubrum yunnanense TaxID=1526162 RepID=A0ABD5YG86_9EURY
MVTLIIIGIYAILAIGMNMHWGDTGLLNFAHAGFFAVGAYTSAILTTPVGDAGLLASRTVGFDFPIVVGMIAAPITAGLFGLLLGITSIRLDGDYLAIVTLAGAETARLIISNEAWLTSGVQTLNNIPRPLDESLPAVLPYDVFYFGLVLLVLLGSYALFRHFANAPFGRVLHAIREDEDVPKALGKDTAWFKLKSFALGAALAGLAGSLWAHYVYAIQPTMFLSNLTFSIWAMVIIGGAGSYFGAVAGAVIVTGIRQITRFLPGDIPLGNELPYLRLIIIGVLLIAVLYYRPHGMFGDKERSLAGMSGGGN